MDMTFEHSALRRAMVVLVSLNLAGLALLVDPTGADPLYLKSAFGLGTALVLGALIVVAALRFGTRIFVRTRINVFVGALALATLASALQAQSTYVAAFGEQGSYLGFTFTVEMLVVYLAISASFRDVDDWRILFGTIAVAGLLAIGYALARPEFRSIDPDGLGRFLAVLFGGALGFAASPRPDAPRARAAAVALAIVALIAAIGLATRGTLLGFATAVVVAALVDARLHGRDRKTVDSYLLRGLVAVTVVAAIVTVSPLAGRVRDLTRAINVGDRGALAASALAALADRPLLGHGPDNFAAAYPLYRQAGFPSLDASLPTSAPSWPLEIALTIGLVGLVLLVVLLMIAGRSLWLRGLARAPGVAGPILVASAAYLGSGLVSFSSLATEWWPWLAVAAAAAIERGPTDAVAPVRNVPRVVARAIVGVALVAALSGLVAVRAGEDAGRAIHAVADGRPEAAIAAARASVQEDSGRAAHWNVLGLAEELAGDWPAASDAYAAAARRAPYVADYWSSLARSRAHELASGSTEVSAEQVLDAARRAVAADPNSPEPNAVLADVASLTGDYDLALQAAARAVRLAPGRAEYEQLAIAAAIALSDPHAAANTIDELLALHDSAALRVARAKLALETNDRGVARDQANRALQLDPENREARAILDQLGR